MIKKERDIPIVIKKLEGLKRRTNPNHPKKQFITEELAKRVAGFRGEQSLDYYLSFINEDYYVFHDLRIPDSEGRYFQIDLLILTNRFIFIGEVKSHKGILTFDQVTPQLLRDFNGKVDAFSDPISQVRRHRYQLRSWLEKNKLLLAPIDFLVIVSNPSTIIKIDPPNHPNSQIICKSDSLPFKVENFEAKYKKEYLTSKDLNKITRLLLKQHLPHNPDLLPQFQIHKSDIFHGVHCPNCEHLPMIRVKGSWLCSACNGKSKTAHINSLMDYALLIDSKISNKKCREFLRLTSPTTTSKILNSLNLPYTGTFKNREYNLEPLLNLQSSIHKHSKISSTT
jgi:hypothetical protein